MSIVTELSEIDNPVAVGVDTHTYRARHRQLLVAPAHTARDGRAG
jgi:hypothetical protein